ncbi:hypothetical protein F5Y13DRAFT_155967 [Hypoxylon sp. FL1857]|nr:hypothetical protein F5Y13DRAFT_155967 [Hypoxylon sp. FL1857]
MSDDKYKYYAQQVAAGQPGMTTNNSQQNPRRNDSALDPGLARALVEMPGSNFRAYDPNRVQRGTTLQRSPAVRRTTPWQRPPVTQPTFIPGYRDPNVMKAATTALRHTQSQSQNAQQNPGKAAAQYAQYAEPKSSQGHLVRRDSNGVSVLGSDDGYQADLRNYTVSPVSTIASSSSKRATGSQANKKWHGAF